MIQVIAKELPRVDRREIVPAASFHDDLGADSLDRVEVVMALEDEFGLEISDVAAEKISTVQQAMDYVTHALRERRQRSGFG